MARITQLPLVRHLRSEPTLHTLHTLQYRAGALTRSGRGLAFWFRPMTTGVAEVPVDDREATFLFHARTVDFQAVTVQGALTYRILDPEQVAAHVDFTIDLAAGTWTRTPLEHLAGLLTQLAQQATLDLLATLDLRSAVRDGIDAVRTAITRSLGADSGLADIGLQVVAVRVTAVSPTAEVEQALQTPLREAIQQQADQATFARRAQAVEKERAIAENELANRIELARREQDLIAQQGANERHRAQEAAASAGIEAQAQAERDRLTTAAQAGGIRELGEAETATEAARMQVYRDVPVPVLLGLAAGELAGKLERIDHLNLSPDGMSGLLGSLLAAGTRRLDDGGAGR